MKFFVICVTQTVPKGIPKGDTNKLLNVLQVSVISGAQTYQIFLALKYMSGNRPEKYKVEQQHREEQRREDDWTKREEKDWAKRRDVTKVLQKSQKMNWLLLIVSELWLRYITK